MMGKGIGEMGKCLIELDGKLDGKQADAVVVDFAARH